MAKAREEEDNPIKPSSTEATPTDMSFLELVNRRLDYVKAYNSERHYTDHLLSGKAMGQAMGRARCSEITGDMIQNYLLQAGDVRPRATRPTRNCATCVRCSTSACIRSEIGYPGIQHAAFSSSRWTRRIKYVPPKEDILRVMLAAKPDVQDYLWTIALTMGRMSEVNRLTWQDVDLSQTLRHALHQEEKGW